MTLKFLGILVIIGLGVVSIIVMAVYLGLKKRTGAPRLTGAILGGLFAFVLALFLLAPARMVHTTATSTQSATTNSVTLESTLTTDQRRSPALGWSGHLMSGAALAMFLVFAYMFLDAGAHGRYTWPLRIGAIAMFFGLCFVLSRYGVDWM